MEILGTVLTERAENAALVMNARLLSEMSLDKCTLSGHALESNIDKGASDEFSNFISG